MDKYDGKASPKWFLHDKKLWFSLLEGLQTIDIDCESLAADLECQSNWKKLAGLSNHNYQVKIGYNDFFVQFVNAAKLVQLPFEKPPCLSNSIYLSANLKPYLIDCLFESEMVRIFTWFEGRQLEKSDLTNPSYRLKLCQMLKAFKEASVKFEPLDIEKHLNKYFNLARQGHKRLPQHLEAKYQEALSYCQYFEPSTLCHNDLNSTNFLLANNADSFTMKVIDWEYATLGDPLFELAGVIINFDLSDKEEHTLLQNYTDTFGASISLNKLEKLKILYQTICSFWSYK